MLAESIITIICAFFATTLIIQYLAIIKQTMRAERAEYALKLIHDEVLSLFDEVKVQKVKGDEDNRVMFFGEHENKAFVSEMLRASMTLRPNDFSDEVSK